MTDCSLRAVADNFSLADSSRRYIEEHISELRIRFPGQAVLAWVEKGEGKVKLFRSQKEELDFIFGLGKEARASAYSEYIPKPGETVGVMY